jgi:hypothetical protein
MTTIARAAPASLAETSVDVLFPMRACDRTGCPAPATCQIDVCDQDFYFCGHHWRELQQPLGGAGARLRRSQIRH